MYEPYYDEHETGFDAFVLGNHEFNDDVDEIVEFDRSLTDDSVAVDGFADDGVDFGEDTRAAHDGPVVYLKYKLKR
ncbi:MAG: hypothetical protein AAF074_07495 [Pseudomonadota bacterium]